MTIYVGTAGWSIRAEFRQEFAAEGSHLERYASRFNAVEINSSFYKPHRTQTYARWAAAVPDDFRFAVKMPKEITHSKMLVDVSPALERFLGEIAGLGTKLQVILVQLPPKQRFQETIVVDFLDILRARYAGPVVCEPRHLSWFEHAAESLLVDYNVSRVAADPCIGRSACMPADFSGVIYHRWHGSPQMYYSAYSDQQLLDLARSATAASQQGRVVWCIFDNTARGAATANALTLAAMTSGSG